MKECWVPLNLLAVIRFDGILGGLFQSRVAGEREKDQVKRAAIHHRLSFRTARSRSKSEFHSRDGTRDGVASDLQLLQSVQVRHTYPRHSIPVHQRHCGHVAGVAGGDQVLETGLPKRQCWPRTGQ